MFLIYSSSTLGALAAPITHLPDGPGSEATHAPLAWRPHNPCTVPPWLEDLAAVNSDLEAKTANHSCMWTFTPTPPDDPGVWPRTRCKPPNPFQSILAGIWSSVIASHFSADWPLHLHLPVTVVYLRVDFCYLKHKDVFLCTRELQIKHREKCKIWVYSL